MTKRQRSQHSRRSRKRSIASYRRQSGHVTGNAILVVCEGIRTEPDYLEDLRQWLRLSTVSVEVVGEGGDPITVVQKAIQLRDQREHAARQAQRRDELAPPRFDEVWCVFDREAANEKATFRQAVDMARREKFQLAISNPAFEYWYLLHFRETSQPFEDANAVIRALRAHDCLPDYEKCYRVFPRLYELTDAAISRAHALLHNHPDFGKDDFPNPSTYVYLLVQGMQGMVSSRR